MSIGRSLAWMGASQIATFGLQFASQVVLLRYLTLHDAGIYAIAFATVGVLSLVQTLGLQAYVVREPTLTPAVTATAFTINAILSVLLAVGVVVVALFGTSFFGDAGVGRVLMVLAVTPIITIASFLPMSVMEREGRFREIALIGTAASVVSAATTIVLAVTGFTYLSAAYAQIGATAVTALFAVLLERRFARPRLGLRSWKQVTDFGVQMLAVHGISALGLRLSDVVLGRTLGLSSLGLYARASGLNGMIWANVHLLIGRVMLVDFADICRSGGSLRDRYIRTVDITTVLLWPIFAGFATIAAPFLLTVYGARWVPATGPLILLAIASMIQVAITMTWEIFTATGNLRTQTRIEFIRSGFAFAAFVMGCFISLEAAAMARIADSVFAMLIYRPHLNRMTDTRFADFAPIYTRNLVLAAVAIAPALAVMAAAGWRADVSLPALGGGIVAGMVLWIAALVVSRHPLAAEVGGWVSRRRVTA